jgi:hypothetical protein
VFSYKVHSRARVAHFVHYVKRLADPISDSLPTSKRSPLPYPISFNYAGMHDLFNSCSQRIFQMKPGSSVIGSLAIALIAASLLAALAGCASTPVPNEKLAVAKASVQRAEQAGGPAAAPAEMAAARDKLARANQAADARNGAEATQLAEQANADARLAEAMADQARSHKAAVEFDESMNALRQESNRATPPTH